MFEAVAFAVHFQDVDVVGQPVEKRASKAFRAEGAGPFIERQPPVSGKLSAALLFSIFQVGGIGH